MTEPTRYFPFEIKACGDSAVGVYFSQEIDPIINQLVHINHRHLQRSAPAGISEYVPTYSSLMVHYDPLTIGYQQVVNWLEINLKTHIDEQAEQRKIIRIPTIYGGKYGPDLDSVAEYHGLTPDEVVKIHTSGVYPVYMMGFTPGYPYLGGLDPAIATPRLKNPRTLVPAGSVGLANTQTGVYSIDSPGGWQIIGWTPLKLFNPQHEQPFLLSPGCAVVFYQIEESEAGSEF